MSVNIALRREIHVDHRPEASAYSFPARRDGHQWVLCNSHVVAPPRPNVGGRSGVDQRNGTRYP